MSMDGNRLTELREGQSGNGANKRDDRTEQVVKLFMDADKIAAIKKSAQAITIGSLGKEITVTIRPLSPGQMCRAWPLFAKLMMPIINFLRALQGGSKTALSLVVLMEAFGENIDQLPEFLFLILARGNNNITQEWVNEDMDLLLDLHLILPLFMEQNGLNKLFLGKQQPPPQPSSNANDEKQSETDGQSLTTAV